MADLWTIAKILDWTRRDFASRKLSSPRLDAELILAHALGLSRVDLYVRFEQPLQPDELARVRGLVERRRRGEPVAYLLGVREFYGRKFAVDARVLVPRPETEGLVEAALEQLAARASGEGEGAAGVQRVLDLGTGSGAVAVTLAAERKDLVVDAVDLSPDAAEVARANAQKHQVEARVNVRVGDLFEGAVRDLRYDAIVSNPPYIPTGDIEGLMIDVRAFEPHLALDGGPDGLRVIERILREAPSHLAADGAVLLELGHDQGPRAADLARTLGYRSVSLREDFARIERVLVARLA